MKAAKKEKRPGRGRKPKFGADRTRGSLTIRLRDRVRDDLEKAAEAAGRSLSEEVEHRLELMLNRRDELTYELGHDVLAIAKAAGQTLWHIERWSGKRWIEDEETFALFTQATAEVIRNYRDVVRLERRDTPHGDFEGKSPTELAKMFASLAGIAPPRPLKQSEFNPEVEYARQRTSLDSWLSTIEKHGSRPIESGGGEILKGGSK
ncbi:hypothetical protein IVA87_08760 [Bradyrhizobium sp. 147]|uniref:hypothetical protein n=1 Tax=Bradyrhizobium sp. 147 TaxID=2782623 RepID=UPI001FFA4190|nr:hypothetical protein [Bradyrhizobium sp. 147]MCK1679550.1 hypothetical protein [Bradyrhizobium sp. 147]